jgi:hypothetical protein
MAAPKRVTDNEVVQAIRCWRGNVAAAADVLGMQPRNLRKRLDSLQVDLERIREESLKDPVLSKGPGPIGPKAATEARSVVESFPRRIAVTSLAHVNDAATAELPIKAIRPRRTPLRLLPEHQDQLRDAKLDFGARFRLETDENAILNQFFEEEFEAWRTKKLDRTEGGE